MVLSIVAFSLIAFMAALVLVDALEDNDDRDLNEYDDWEKLR